VEELRKTDGVVMKKQAKKGKEGEKMVRLGKKKGEGSKKPA